MQVLEYRIRIWLFGLDSEIPYSCFIGSKLFCFVQMLWLICINLIYTQLCCPNPEYAKQFKHAIHSIYHSSHDHKLPATNGKIIYSTMDHLGHWLFCNKPVYCMSIQKGNGILSLPRVCVYSHKVWQHSLKDVII